MYFIVFNIRPTKGNTNVMCTNRLRKCSKIRHHASVRTTTAQTITTTMIIYPQITLRIVFCASIAGSFTMKR